MAKIGTLGKIVFSVSDRKVQTFDDLSIETGAKYYKHDRHLYKPLLEFGGMENDKLSFCMYHSVFLGADPEKQLKQIDKYLANGEILSLIIGGKKYGGKWVITKHSKGYKKFDGKGKLLAVESKISLEEYASR